MRVGIVRADELGVEDSYGRGQLNVLDVVVAYDEVDAQLLGIGYLVDGFYSAVKYDDKLYASLFRLLDTLE